MNPRQRGKIRPIRKGLVGGDDVDFEKVWGVLSSAFRQIHTKNASVLSYEELYRHAYRSVLKKNGDQLYQRVHDFEKDWLSVDVRRTIQDVLSPSLLASLDSSVGGTSGSEKRVAGEKFLKGLKEAWRDHQLCAGMLADVLMYMDRVYCADHKKPAVYTISMSLFREQILQSPAYYNDDSTVLEHLNRMILTQIDMERKGEIIDKQLIKSCVHMLENLYDDLTESEETRLYVISFEKNFLLTSTDFYRDQAQVMLTEYDAGAYCRYTMKKIVEERDRCRSTLSESTTPKIIKVLDEELIKNRLQDLINATGGVRYMIDNDRIDDLKLFYELNARVDSKKSVLSKAVQDAVADMGAAINKEAITASQAPAAAAAVAQTTQPEGNEKDTERGKAPDRSINVQTAAALKWVDDVLQLKDKFDRIWREAFESDQGLQTSLTRSFSDFINSVLFPRSTEYISLFIDDNMKKGIKGKTENEVDLVLEKAITLLRYVQDKDLFERYYKKHLGKRLLLGKSISNDIEKQMISRMKLELGNNFTVKMESMFKDITISEELSSGFKEHIASLGDPDPKRVELGMIMMTGNAWPTEFLGGESAEGGKTKCIYPAVLERLKRGFEKYYGEKHSGRTVSWLGHLGQADIRATFPKVPVKEGGFRERRHELNVSTYAMVILLLFNDLANGQSLSFEEIQARTNIPANDLVRNLQSLAVAPKTRVLLKEPAGRDVKPSDRFVFNEGFQGKFVKIKVGVITAGNKVEDDKERRETERRNNDSRGFCIEAAVVRIMKQRKVQSHTSLVTETLAQVASQFKPDVTMIKKRIESLIEREYLERVDDADVPSYRYLA